jgi:hypothetical protein
VTTSGRGIEVRLHECVFAAPSHTQPGGVDLVIFESRYCYGRPSWLNDSLWNAVTGDAATTRGGVQ